MFSARESGRINLPNVTGWAVAVDGETQRPSVLLTSGKYDNSGTEVALNRYYYASAAMLRFLYFAGCKRLRVEQVKPRSSSYVEFL